MDDLHPDYHWWEHSAAYRKANEDLEFLNRDELRPVRLQLELLKPELAFINHRIRSTIVVFGSTRLVERTEAERRVAAMEKDVALQADDPTLRIRLEAARRLLSNARFYDEARTFGRLVSEADRRNEHYDYVIITGGGPGIMEAANRGAYEVGAESIGLNITLPHEQEPNSYITPELCFQFRYFAIRKMHFLLRAKGLVAFPGGFGTMDELFEALTLVQTQKIPALPIVLMGRQFWSSIIHFDQLVAEGVIDQHDAELFRYAETAREAWEYIRAFHAQQK
ncbi:MAG: LOG family protein [Candidatus Zixiibacteriota bacterium]